MTSQGPGTSIDFGVALAKELYGQEKADELAKGGACEVCWIRASNKVSTKVKAISFAENGSYFVTAGNRWVVNTSNKSINVLK